jgi:L-ribulokinase
MWTRMCALPPWALTATGKMLIDNGTSTCHMVLDDEEKMQVPGMCGVVEDGIMPGLCGL